MTGIYMTKKELLENMGYEIVPSIGDPNCYRLLKGDKLIFDDTACEDVYGDVEDVASFFLDYVIDYE